MSQRQTVWRGHSCPRVSIICTACWRGHECPRYTVAVAEVVPTPTFPSRLEIPQTARDSHFPPCCTFIARSTAAFGYESLRPGLSYAAPYGAGSSRSRSLGLRRIVTNPLIRKEHAGVGHPLPVRVWNSKGCFGALHFSAMKWSIRPANPHTASSIPRDRK